MSPSWPRPSRRLFRPHKDSPLAHYARFLLNHTLNHRAWPGLDQGYMAMVTDSSFEGPCRVYDQARVTRCSVGRFSYVGEASILAAVDVGRFCSIGPGCRIGLGIHPSRVVATTHPAFFSSTGQAGATFVDAALFDEERPVKIGSDVWIGANVAILGGVTVGDGAIIGAGAVVTKDVAPYTVVAGVPARAVRPRFDAATVAVLLEHRWWDKDDAWLNEHKALFLDVAALVAALKRA